MESEIVEIDLFPEKSIVRCSFEMVNYGPTTSLEIGFPVMDFQYWGIGGYSDIDKSNFEIQIDSTILTKEDIKVPKEMEKVYDKFMEIFRNGKELRKKNDSIHKLYNIVERKDGSLIFPKNSNKDKIQITIDSINSYYWERIGLSGDLTSEFYELTENGKFPWYVWDVSFKENETRKIMVSYELPSGLAGKNAFRYFKYILNTGAGWYKDIGKADIIINLKGIEFKNIDKLSPNNYTFDEKNNQISWHFKNIEPTINDDVYLQYSIPKEKRKYEKWKRKMNRKFSK